MTRARLTCLCLLLAGCESFPALDARLTEAARAAPYPDLVPMEGLLAEADAALSTPPPVLSPARIAALEAERIAAGTAIDPARQAALAARAEALRDYRFAALQ